MKELLKKLGLDETISNQILAKYDDEIANINNDLNNKVKALELKETELSEMNKSLKNLQKLEPEKIKEELENTKNKMKELEQTHATELKNLKIDNAINTSLLKSGALNNKAVLPFINKDLINFDDKGNVIGLDDQLKELMANTETSFLFKIQEQGGINGLEIRKVDNATPGNGIGKPINNNWLNQKTFEIGNIPNFESFEAQYDNQ